MIIAVPLSRGRLARHFTKAKTIAFYNEDFELLETLENPAIAGGCAAKKAMLDLIKNKGSNCVLVDMIGERMLGKLLATGAIISKGNSSHKLEDVLTACLSPEYQLTHASQGRASINHEKKGGCGGGCSCGGHEDKDELHSLLSMNNMMTQPSSPIHFSHFKKC